MKRTNGWFVMIPIADPALGLAILNETKLHGAVVPADTHLNQCAVEHLVRAAQRVA